MSKANDLQNIVFDPTLLAELRRMEIRTRRSVDSDMLGNYRSAFRGTGLTFSDLREYQPGDDTRHIHWKATARSKVAYVKNYQEERQLRLLFAIDTSGSMNFGAPRSKYRRAIEFCALLSTLAYKCGDIFGLTLFSSEVHQSIKPRGGRSQLQRLFLSLLAEQSDQHQKTSIPTLMDHLLKNQKQSSMIFIISDFLSENFESNLRILATKHDVVMVNIIDPLDQDLRIPSHSPITKHTGGISSRLTKLFSYPTSGLIRFTDYETGKERVVDTGSSRVMRELKKREEQRIKHLNETSRKSGADVLHISDSPLRPLHQLMVARARRY